MSPAQRVHHSSFEQARGLAYGFPQGGAGLGRGQTFEGQARALGNTILIQQRGERGDGLRRADEAQLLTRIALLDNARVGFERGDEF